MRYITIILLSVIHLYASVDLNNATVDELIKLNGIGKHKSQKIIDYRNQHHCFQNLDELANVDGVSKKILSTNRSILKLGECKEALPIKNDSESSLSDVLLDPVNMVFVVIIFALALLDQKTGKDLKSQIISVGVLGTFVGIFIGLQSFNPNDILHSVNDILVGLKTAFFTSIVGMSVSILLSVVQELKANPEDK